MLVLATRFVLLMPRTGTKTPLQSRGVFDYVLGSITFPHCYADGAMGRVSDALLATLLAANEAIMVLD